MEIAADAQEATDFDWFGIDDEGLVGYFTTAGFKRLPQSVAAKPDHGTLGQSPAV